MLGTIKYIVAEYKYGFGHEEWLFDIAKTINGYHYGHIQAVASYYSSSCFL